MRRLLFSGLFVFLASGQAHADILFFDIDADPSGFAAATAGFSARSAYDFDVDADYAISILADGAPLDSAGFDPVSAGNLDPIVTIWNEEGGPGGPGGTVDGGSENVAVGPSAGFGNTSNSVLTNILFDAFIISFEGGVDAFDGNFINLLGTGSLDLIATDTMGNQFFLTGVSVPATGSNIGFVATEGSSLASISAFDSGSGFAGLQGSGTIHTQVVPEPSSVLAILGLAGLVVVRRRR